MPDVQSLVDDFVMKLRKRKVEGSMAAAKQTAELLRSVISQQRLPDSNQASTLVSAVNSIAEKLSAGNHVELAVGNIVRRVLHIIREENLLIGTEGFGELNAAGDDSNGDMSAILSATAVRKTLSAPSLQTLLEDHASCSEGDSEGKSKAAAADQNWRSKKLKHGVIEAMNELIEDITNSHEQISERAVEHIHHDEVILTLGSSRTVARFLLAAKEKKRSFRVLVAEGAPRCEGLGFAKELVTRGLETTLITDSAVFVMISRVHMVVVGAHAVMANGGVIAPVGVNILALAARRHAVPFVVLAGSHKLCPLYPHNPEVLLNEMRCPSELLDFGDFSDCMDYGSGTGSPSLCVVNPAFDYIQPSLVSLFITDTGGYNPSYMYRLVADYYSANDLVLKL